MDPNQPQWPQQDQQGQGGGWASQQQWPQQDQQGQGGGWNQPPSQGQQQGGSPLGPNLNGPSQSPLPPPQGQQSPLPQPPGPEQPKTQEQEQWGTQQQWGSQIGSGPLIIPTKIPPPFPKNDESLKIPAPTPGVKAGYLMKAGKKNTSLKKRYFLLIHDSILYYKDQKAKKAQGRIPMCEIITVEKAINKPHMKGKIEDYELHFFFAIVTVERLYYILTNSLEECDHWVVAIMQQKNQIPYAGPEISRFQGTEDPNLVREGKLEKRGSDPTSGLKSRWFTLVYSNYEGFDNYYLSYFKDKKAVTKMNMTGQPPKGTIPLAGCRLYMIGPEIYEIAIVNSERIYCIKAKTIKEMCEWLLDFKFAVDTANRALQHKISIEQSYAFNYRPPTFNTGFSPTLY